MTISQKQHYPVQTLCMVVPCQNSNIFIIKKIVEQLILTQFNKQNVFKSHQAAIFQKKFKPRH